MVEYKLQSISLLIKISLSVTNSPETQEETSEIKKISYHKVLDVNLMILELIKERNLVLKLTQENLIKNSVQDCLPYILNYHGLCYYFSSLL